MSNLIDIVIIKTKYLITLRWSYTVIYALQILTLLFLLFKESWIALGLFTIFFLSDNYYLNKKVEKIEDVTGLKQ